MNLRACLAFLFFAGVLTSLKAEENENTTRLNSLVITGCQSFTPESIRKKLMVHPKLTDAQKLSSETWMTTVRDLVLSGYQTMAYADASVTISGSELQVVEGRRYLSGEIRFEGAPESAADPVRACLLGEHASSAAYILSLSQKDHKTPVTWNPDLPFVPSDEVLSKYRARIRELFDQDGLAGTQFEVAFVRDMDRTRVDLVVRVSQFGEAQVSEIEFEGLTRHTPEELIEFLKLKPGPFSLSDKLRGESQLRETGRFLSHRAELIEPFRTGDPHALKIHVKECPGSPLLSEPLNLEQEILLKTRRWLENFETNRHELVVSAWPINRIIELSPAPKHDYEAELILSPTRQVGLRIEPRSQSGPPVGGYLLGVSDDWLSVASYFTGKQLLWHRSDNTRMVLGIDLHGIDIPFDEKSVGLNFGQSINNKAKDRNKPPLMISIAPAALFYRPPEEQNSPLSITPEGAQLHVQTRMTDSWLDAETGRPDRVILRDEAFPDSALTISTRPDRIHTVWNEWLARRPMQVLVADNAPASVIAEFLIGEWNFWAPEQSLGRTAVLKLIQPELLTTIDQALLTLASSAAEDEFYIPGENDQWWAELVEPLLRSDTEFLRPGSTASSLFKALIQVKILPNEANLEKLADAAGQPDCGPLNCVVFGAVSTWMAPTTGPIWGQLGLNRMSEEEFQADLEQWLHEDQQLGRMANRIVRRMQSLTDEEAAALSTLCSDTKSAQIVSEIVTELRKPISEGSPRERDAQELARFRAALTRLWAPLFRPLVARQLLKMSGGKQGEVLVTPSLRLQ